MNRNETNLMKGRMMNDERKYHEPAKTVIDMIEQTLNFINPTYNNEITDETCVGYIPQCRLLDMLDHIFDCDNIRLCCHVNGFMIDNEFNIAYDVAKLPNIISFCETIMCSGMKSFHGEIVDHIVYHYAVQSCLLLIQYHYYQLYENEIHRNEHS